MTSIKLNGRLPHGQKNFFNEICFILRSILPIKKNKFKLQTINSEHKYNKSIIYNKYNSNTLYYPTIQQSIIKFKIKTIKIPFPKINIYQFLFILLLVILSIILILSYEIYMFFQNEYDYRERIKHEIVYNLERYLEPYTARQRDLELKINTLNEILPLDSEFRRRLILKYTGYDIKNER